MVAPPPGAAPEGLPAALAAATAAGATTYSSSNVWQLELAGGGQGSGDGSPLRQPLKTLAVAAAGASAGATPKAADDGAHLIAPSRTVSGVEEVCEALNKKHVIPAVQGRYSLLSPDESGNDSPRISTRVTRGPNNTSQQLEAVAAAGVGILRSLSRQLQLFPVFGAAPAASNDGNGSTGGLVPAATAGTVVVARQEVAGATHQSHSDAYVELAVDDSGSIVGSMSPSAWAANTPASAAHLLAPAVPAFQSEGPSPPEAELLLLAAGSSLDTSSPLQQPDQQQQQQHEAGALPAEPSGLSSPSSGGYSAAAAVTSSMAASGAAVLGEVVSGQPPTPDWQRQQQEAEQVQPRRSHPIFSLQDSKETGSQQQQTQALHQGAAMQHSLAGLQTLVSSHRRRSGTGGESPASDSVLHHPQPVGKQAAAGISGNSSSSAEPRPKAWSEDSTHIALNLPADCSGPRVPAPAATTGRSNSSAAAAVAAGSEYRSLLVKFEQLDLKRTRQAVRASLKHQHEVLVAATAPSPTLVQRLFKGCFTGGHAHKLRRPLEHQRLQLLCLGRVPYDPDQPLHFELWTATCRSFEGLGSSAAQPLHATGSPPLWQLLGFRAANPAGELCGAGVMPLLMLLMMAERAPQLAARLLAASQGSLAVAAAEARGLPFHGFSLAEVAVEVTHWTLRLLASGGLHAAAQHLDSTYAAAELFWLGAIECLLERWEPAAASELGFDLRRLLLAVLVQAKQDSESDVVSTVQRWCKHV